ncbi:tyrosine-type recombinase/integrase [uncultured Flavonifractor sp.]|uniref:tyrosine-type recombinase/integrase n=1 Tax=uncultured Flavonifractor sp. TaxID=1193534 RepID=UPI002632D636|nr:site-specific integrase [uncultured Flavonifractor sp.]
MATVRKREGKKGVSYQIRASCGYDSRGKQIVRSETWRPAPGMTPAQIKRELERRKVALETQELTISGAVKFEDFAERWFKEVGEHTLRANTLDATRRRAARVYQGIGHIRLDKLTALHIQSLINNLQEEGINKTTGGGLAPSTIRGYMAFISIVLTYAAKIGVISSNPCSRVTLPASKHKEKEVYTIQEAQQLLDSLQGAPTVWRVFFTLAIYGGFRRGELLGLEWPDIDLEGQTISIRRTSNYTKSKGMYTDTTKTVGSQRTVKMPLEVISLLRSWKAEQAQQRLILGQQWGAGDRVFTSDEGKAVATSSPREWLSRHCKRTGQRCLGIHVFRHLNASLLITGGADVRTVSAMLGHSNTSTTLDLYAHTFQEAQARASEAVADLLQAKAK